MSGRARGRGTSGRGIGVGGGGTSGRGRGVRGGGANRKGKKWKFSLSVRIKRLTMIICKHMCLSK